jgi:hypothetical protein
MTGPQVDSAVYAAVKYARDVGRFVPVKLLESSDTSLVVLLRSESSGDFTVRFTPALQPSTSQVVVQVDR